MFLNIFYGATSILIMHKLFQICYPILYQKLLMFGVYNTVYAYSCGQLMCAKYLQNFKINHNDCFNFISNGEHIRGLSIDKDFVSAISTLKQSEPLDYDFILYEHDYNTIIYLNIPINLDYIVSDITFLLFTVCYDDKIYDIALSKINKYNFYIVNNIIDKQFLIYYFNNYLKIYINDFTFQATIIDHNVNLIYFTEKDRIIILKDDYTLIKDDAVDSENDNDCDDNVKNDSDSDSGKSGKSEISYDL